MVLMWFACSSSAPVAVSSSTRTVTEDVPSIESVAAASAVTYEERVKRAHALRMTGAIDEARNAYSALLDERPDDVIVLLAAGEFARTEHRCREAEPWLRRAAALAPDSPVAWEHLSVCLWELDREDEALAAVDAAEARGSTDASMLRKHIETSGVQPRDKPIARD